VTKVVKDICNVSLSLLSHSFAIDYSMRSEVRYRSSR